jgi:hypothetical protein
MEYYWPVTRQSHCLKKNLENRISHQITTFSNRKLRRFSAFNQISNLIKYMPYLNFI